MPLPLNYLGWFKILPFFLASRLHLWDIMSYKCRIVIMKPRIRISDAEWEVMWLVWEKPPGTASEITDRLVEKKGWGVRTIRTLIERLVKKQMLRTEVDGKRYLYWPRVTKEECVQKESRSFQERVFGGEPAAMMIHLVKQTEFSPEEIQELQRILSEKKD